MIAVAHLSTALSEILYAVSRESVKYGLNGIHIESDDASTTFVSTDGHRLARTVVMGPSSLDAPRMLLDLKTAKAIIKYLKKHKNQLVELSTVDGRITIHPVGSSSSSWALIDGEFPDYKPIIPDNPKAMLSCVKRGVLTAALKATVKNPGNVDRINKDSLALAEAKAALVTARAESVIAIAASKAKVKKAVDALDGAKSFLANTKRCAGQARLNLGGDQFVVSPYYGSCPESIEVDVDGYMDGETGVSIAYLQDTLKSVKVGSVDLEFSGPLSPIVIRAQSEFIESTHVVMPVRL